MCASTRRGRAMRRGTGAACVWSAPRRGMSLIEAVAALAIVGVTSVALLGMAAAHTRAADRARRAHEVDALAGELMATIDALAVEPRISLPDSLREGRFAPPFNEYTWRAELVSAAPVDKLQTVRIEITWPGGGETFTTQRYPRTFKTIGDVL